jgi:osmotically-inducible protein OsmY
MAQQRTANCLVQANVSDELLYMPNVGAHLMVTADDGTVTLTGEVNSLPERSAARDAAARVWGVATVVDEMTVELPEAARREDHDLEQAGRQLLDWSVAVPQNAVSVAVQDQVMTLTGAVTWAFQSDAATRAVSDLRGVRAIHNRLTIHRVATVSVVTQAIEAAMQRNAPLDATAIAVTVDTHMVTLSGEVRSAAERRQAGHVARAAAGVADVRNNLTIAA